MAQQQYGAPGLMSLLWKTSWGIKCSWTMHCINKLELGLHLTIDSFSGTITCKNLCLSLTLAEATNIVWSCWHLGCTQNDERRSFEKVIKSHNIHNLKPIQGIAMKQLEDLVSTGPARSLTSFATPKESKLTCSNEEGIKGHLGCQYTLKALSWVITFFFFLGSCWWWWWWRKLASFPHIFTLSVSLMGHLINYSIHIGYLWKKNTVGMAIS